MLLSANHSPLPRIYEWFSAIAAQDTLLLNTLLTDGMPIDVLHPLRHSTALMEATRRGNISTVQWLLKHGAAPDLLSGKPLTTVLHCALQFRHWDIATLLATTIKNCALMNTNGATPLHVLCAESTAVDKPETNLILASFFITNHCPLDALDHEGTTALHYCAINDLVELANLLLIRGANPNALIPDSQVSPLTIAALEKNKRMAKLLLKHGANPNLKTHDGSTPLSIYPVLSDALCQPTLRHTQNVAFDSRPHQR